MKKHALEQLNIQDLNVLLAVAETGSFRKASAHLTIGQSAVTRRVQKLEDALGVSLFERRRSGARLTNAGVCFVARTRVIVNDLHAAMEQAQSAGVAGNGHLHIGLITSLSRGVVRDVVATFVDRHPNIDICFTQADRGKLLTHLSHRAIDVVIAAGEPNNDNGDSLLLVREDIYLAVSRASTLAGQTRLSWHDVADEMFLVSSKETGPEIHDYIIRRVSDLDQPAKVRRHRVERGGIINLVGLGFGVSLVSDHWRGVSYPNVVFVPIGNPEERVPFSIIWRPENDNPALRRFLSLSRAAAKNALAPVVPSQTHDPSP